VTAGRIVSRRLRDLAADKKSFCFETNLASPGLVGRIDSWRANGYDVRLIFVSLPAVDLALTRVAIRVAAGGHDVLRKRFVAGSAPDFGTFLVFTGTELTSGRSMTTRPVVRCLSLLDREATKKYLTLPPSRHSRNSRKPGLRMRNCERE
jgi:hypothetical protein